jgi:small subunit ribosomal protein S2
MEEKKLDSLVKGEKSGVQVTVKTLLDAGAHFGHQTERWNPKMLPYIFGERNGVHILNLDHTLRKWEIARKFIVDRVSLGGQVLFVGTKLQSREIIQREAERCGSYYVTSRWLGGTLTNFGTIRRSIERMKKLEELLAATEVPDSKVKLNKKEKLNISRQIDKLVANIGGIRSMKKTPDILFVVDINKEDLAVAEARRLHIPVVALVDSNVDPEVVDFAIPSNDDASRAVELFSAAVADSVLEGLEIFKARFPRGIIAADAGDRGDAGEAKNAPSVNRRGKKGASAKDKDKDKEEAAKSATDANVVASA